MPDPLTRPTLDAAPDLAPSEPERKTTAVEAPPPQPAPELPRPFGRYELRALLGRGGMGAVYLAHDPQLDRLVALKVPRHLGDDANGWRKRFEGEARAAATLQHPNICPVFEVGEVEAQPYLTMAFIDGESLAARLKRTGRLPVRDAVGLVRTLAGAVAEAHERGVIHRDLKPGNVMIDRRGRPLVMDFGLALRASAGDDLRLTLSGVAVGTPAYMPPEQAGGDHEAIGPPTDVYALGVILYEMVTGRVPFAAPTFGKLLAQIERDPPPPPSGLNPDIDPALDAVLLTALEKEPRHRFADAAAFAEALAAYERGERESLVAQHGIALERAARLTGPYLPAVDRPPAPALALPPPRRPRRLAVALAAFGAVLLALGGVVFYVQTDYGELVVELSDPQAKVDVKVNGQEVVIDPNGKPIRIRAGKNHKLEVSGPDFETASESFDVKRGGATVVRVTLRRKKDPPVVVPPKKDLPKPPPYPAGPTVIDLPGWQVLADATQEQMQKWLDERKKAKHSVLWLDAASVGDRPLFVAVAAEGHPVQDKWRAFLDVPAVPFPTEVAKLNVDRKNNHFASLASYLDDEKIRVAMLFHPEVAGEFAIPAVDRQTLPELKAQAAQSGHGYAVFRPSPGPRGATMTSAVTVQMAAGEMAFDTTAAGLEEFEAQERAAGRRLTTVTAYPVDGELKFAATSAGNRAKWEWSVDTGLTAADLKAKATGRAGKGFRPSCLTAYAWDGAVRYCVVWVKEPPRPVEYPKGPTLIETPGWQVLADANKEQMQKWLDERNKAKHSVTWLDAQLVAGRPLYSAVAALDDRAPDWRAFLAVECARGEKVDQSFAKVFAVHSHRSLSVSAYTESGVTYAVGLWLPERVNWILGVEMDPTILDKEVTPLLKNGLGLRVLRPYLIDKGVVQYALYIERRPGVKTAHAFGLTGPRFTEFLDQQRAAGLRPTSVAAAPQDGEVLFAATMADSPTVVAWEVDTGLTAQTLRTRAKDMAGRQFVPTSVTAYPWDGAVRYCVVWVKEPPRSVEYPKQPTLIEVPGWQVLSNATQEQMQKWLDERKKARHSVVWLDAVQVGEKPLPLYVAVAALDDRHPNWQAFLDTPADDFGKGKMAALIGPRTDHPLAASGYLEGKDLRSVSLWRKGLLPHYFDPDSTPEGLKTADEQLRQGDGVFRVIRPYPIPGGGTRSGIVGHRAFREQGAFLVDVPEERMRRFVQERREAGEWVTSLATYPKDGQLLCAVVGSSNLDKREWSVDYGLTVERFKARAAELAGEGYRPAQATLCPWDGAVRYYVVWVKEPPKEK
jgi:hypothetical protein